MDDRHNYFSSNLAYGFGTSASGPEHDRSQKEIYLKACEIKAVLGDIGLSFGFVEGQLHFPYTKILPRSIFVYENPASYFFSASTPGNGLPSIHSRKAPPAVET